MKKLFFIILILASIDSFCQEIINYKKADVYYINKRLRTTGSFTMDKADQYDYIGFEKGRRIEIYNDSIIIQEGYSRVFIIKEKAVTRMIKEDLETEIETIVALEVPGNNFNDSKFIIERVNNKIQKIQIKTLGAFDSEKDYYGNKKIIYSYIKIIDSFE